MNIDLHTHILPGIDDGARDMGTALEMLNIAGGDGTGHIILTPHYIHGSVNNTRDVVGEKCLELMGKAASEGMGVNLHPGSEVFISPEIPELAKEGVICTLNNSMYILVELPMMSFPEYTEDVLYRLKLNGFTPVIAHPERYQEVSGNPSMLYDYIRRGALCQVNSSSLTGLYGKSVKETALTLLRHNMVHFVASDAHTCGGRSPKLQRARDMVAVTEGESMAEALFETNGLAVIDNSHIEAPEPEKVSKAKNWFIAPAKFLGKMFG